MAGLEGDRAKRSHDLVRDYDHDYGSGDRKKRRSNKLDGPAFDLVESPSDKARLFTTTPLSSHLVTPTPSERDAESPLPSWLQDGDPPPPGKGPGAQPAVKKSRGIAVMSSPEWDPSSSMSMSNVADHSQ